MRDTVKPKLVGKVSLKVIGRQLEDGEFWVYTFLLSDGRKVKQRELEKRFVSFGVPIKCNVYKVDRFMFGGSFLYYDIFKRY